MDIFTTIILVIALAILYHTAKSTFDGKYNLMTFLMAALIIGSLSTVMIGVNNLRTGRHDAFPNNVIPFIWNETIDDLF